MFTRHEQDGDYHVDVAPDTGYMKFLVNGNLTDQYGSLVVEIMPGQRLPLPVAGERIAVFGTWVNDTMHGWNEIHPIWAIKYFDTGRTVYALPPSTPQYGSGSGGGGGGGGGGGDCDPNYVVMGGPCLKAGIGDYDCYGGSGNGPNYTPAGATIKVVGSDPFGLDADHDGIACG